MADADTFYDLYLGLTNRAIELYAKGNRRKFALKLHGSLAALDLYVWPLHSRSIVLTNQMAAQTSKTTFTSLSNLLLIASPLFTPSMDIAGVIYARPSH